MEYYSLVIHAEGAEAPEGVPCEPSLMPESKRLLPQTALAEWDLALAEHLLRRIERNPRELRAHTQRILMLGATGDSSATFGACVDLFIALGRFGYDLRYSLLQQVGECLLPEHFQFLKQRLRKGVSANEQLPDGSYAALSDGCNENHPLVLISDLPRYQQESGVIVLVQRLISEGSLVQACEIMENALLRDPGDRELVTELLQLYQQHHLADAFRRVYFSLAGRKLAEPQRWHALEQEFSQAHNPTLS